MITEYPDKLGVYRIGDMKFYSKLQAIEMHTKTGIHPHWDFNEAVFSSYDWTAEPSEHLLEIYRRRAQQLRDRYDYIVLIYSGGADSETVLQSFVNNDIKLDEVASYVNYSGTKDKTSWMNNEIFHNAIPRIERLRDQCPWLKHRIIELPELQLEYFSQKSITFDWLYYANTAWTSNCVARDNFGMKIREWADLIVQGKKLCLLWGYDKPRVVHENNRYSMRFIDILDSGPNVNSFAGKNDYTDELFYWTPDMPEIVIKQGHMIKNYLNQNLTTSPYVSPKKSDLAYRTVNGTKYWLNMDGLHSIIYPNYAIGTLSAPKPSNSIVSPRDSWWYTLESSNRAYHVWQMGIDQLWKTLPDYWKNDPNDISRGPKLCWSKEYYLE